MKNVLCAALVLALFSCKKEDKTAITVENLSGTYKQTAETINGQSTWNDNFYDACERDDLHQLNKDGNYTQTDAGETCGGPTTASGKWTLNDKAIVIDGESGTVTSFDGKTLIIESKESYMGMTATVIATFAKQ